MLVSFRARCGVCDGDCLVPFVLRFVIWFCGVIMIFLCLMLYFVITLDGRISR